MSRGKLILIEGLDRTGKSTQCAKLVEALNNSELIKFPDRSTQIGQLINQYLTNDKFEMPDQSIHLLFSANRWELNDTLIKKLIEEGKNVVLDRYVYSGVAYSAAKETPGMDLKWCLDCDRGLVKPDVTLFLVNQNSNVNRGGFGDERYETVTFQERVRTQFYKLFEIMDSNEVITIDVTDKSIEQVHNDIMHTVEPLIATKIDANITTLNKF